MVPLYPTYFMPYNSQNMLSTTAIKKCNENRSVRIEALQCLKLTDNCENSTIIHTNKRMTNKETLDYVSLTLLKIEDTHQLKK